MNAFKHALDYIDNSSDELFDGNVITMDDGVLMVISDMGYYPQSEDEYLNFEPYHNGWERCEQDGHWFRKGERHVIVSPRKLWEY